MSVIYPQKDLSNPYYFIKNKVLFKISYDKGGDEDCASHKVTYKTKDTVLKKGDNYYDLHGDLKTASENGNYAVKTKDIDCAQSSSVFPYFSVEYDKTGQDSLVKYYWLQSLINDGDTVDDNGKFLINAHTKGYIDYVDLFRKAFIDQLTQDIKNGATKNGVKTKYPHYFFKNCEYKTSDGYEYNGKVNNFAPLTDEEIDNIIIDALNAKAVAYSNNILKAQNLKFKNSNIKLITKDNTESID